MADTFWTPVKVLVAVVLGVLIIGYGSVAIWRGSWDLAAANAKRSYQIQKIQTNNDNRIAQQGYANQAASVTRFDNDQTNLDQLESQISLGNSDPTLAADKATAQQTAQDACAAAQQMTPGTITSLGTFDGKWIKVNCQGGTLAPASKYFAR